MIFFFLISFILGIGVSSFLPIPFFTPVVEQSSLRGFVYLGPVLLLFLIIGFVFSKKVKRFLPLILVCLIGFGLGDLRLSLAYPKIDEHHLAFYNEKEIIWQGRVSKEPEQRLDRINLIVDPVRSKTSLMSADLPRANRTSNGVEATRIDNFDLHGRALISVPLYSDYQYGDVLEIEGELKTPLKIVPPQQDPALEVKGFDYREYLAAKNIYSLSYSPKIKILERGAGNFFFRNLLKIKNKINLSIKKNFTEPQGSLISAIFLGSKKLIPEEIRTYFSLTGISHLLAISGLHLVILISILSFILIEVFLISRRKIFYFLLPIVIGYILMIGSPASAIRAGIMSLVLVLAEMLGKKRDQLNLLVFTCFLMLIFNPKLLAWDIGFELSFLAVLGIYLLNQDFEKIFSKIPNKKFLPLRSCLSVTLSAQILTFPLILYYFGNLSLSAPLVNILVLPVLPFLMFFNFIFALSSLFVPFLAKLLVWPVWLLITYIVMVAKFFAGLPYFSFVFGKVSLWLIFFLYFLIVFLIFKIKKFGSSASENSG